MKYAVEPSLIPKIKSEYIQGRGSVREICEKYSIPEGKIHAVKVRASNEDWTQLRETQLNSVCQKITQKAVSKVDSWLERVSNRSERDWDLIDKSIETLVGAEGCIDPDAIAGYVRARKTIDDMKRRSLGLSDVNLDVTSKGLSIGESLVSALTKLRAVKEESPRLTEAEIDAAVECEIVPD